MSFQSTWGRAMRNGETLLDPISLFPRPGWVFVWNIWNVPAVIKQPTLSHRHCSTVHLRRGTLTLVFVLFPPSQTLNVYKWRDKSECHRTVTSVRRSSCLSVLSPTSLWLPNRLVNFAFWGLYWLSCSTHNRGCFVSAGCFVDIQGERKLIRGLLIASGICFSLFLDKTDEITGWLD